MRGEFIIDITQANSLLDEQRRLIEAVTRRCFFKGNNHPLICRACPAWAVCSATNSHKEEKRNAS